MKNRTLKTDRMSVFTVSILFLLLCFGMTAEPKIASKGTYDGLETCINILVPSLFPFMFLSSFAVMYGISQRIGRIFSKLTESLFALPSEAGVTIFLSLIGGFPVGAIGINSLYKHDIITQKQAQRMLCFCVNSGPGFLISVVGARLYGSVKVGVILTAVQAAVSILTGIILGQIAKNKEPIVKKSSSSQKHKSFSDAFVHSCKSACASTAMLCSMVVLFSCFTELAEYYFKFGNDSTIGIIIRSVCEVTDGCTAIADNRLPIYYAAMCAGFGGLCVHFQIFSAVSDININKPKFILARIACGVFCAAAVFIICRILPLSSDVFSNTEESSFSISSVTYCSSAAFLVTIIAFLICTSGLFYSSGE